MITNELLAFVKEELSKGTSEEEIQKALVEGGGWTGMDVKEAFDAVGIYSNTYQGTVSRAFSGAGTVKGSPAEKAAERTIEHGPLA
ncbi:hypothetical protein L0Y49_03325, partial [bacterium]|nr:hypothetical protein [bacterium]